MKISVVTISYNQAQFLRECIDSVLSQGYPDLEYIIVDPGSTDGSREIIDSYGDRVIRIYEKDNGPAHGLNNGFARATGDIFCFLNSDDSFLPGALNDVAAHFDILPDVDVISGHSYVVDRDGGLVRRFYSDRFSLWMKAHRACVLSQASTFFQSRVYHKVGGFNVENRIGWDGELFIDFALAGARFARVNAFWSNFRLYDGGLTGSGTLRPFMDGYAKSIFKKITGRDQTTADVGVILLAQFLRKCLNPKDVLERIYYGPIGPSR
jgi:glycosyltransferase involved in cell wall biosynthesis